MDKETDAILACVTAIEPLDGDARKRTMEYLQARYVFPQQADFDEMLDGWRKEIAAARADGSLQVRREMHAAKEAHNK